MKHGFVLILGVLVGMGSIQNSIGRTWTQAATGKKIEADLVKVQGDNVVLKLGGGKTASVAIARSVGAEPASIIRVSR